ncbi:DNA-binding protein [Pseudonocardiaceae bacterium YIM PH 21723]|nr:DNA-binding protein [Pseudonocardiaceae bacterium YIM PH 21723]
MALPLETVLARSGLRATAAEFLALVEEAVQRFAPPDPIPADHFSAAEAGVLSAVGLNLNPLGAEEADGRTRTVIALTILRDSALSVTDAAARLDVDTSRIRHQLAERQLLGWKEQGNWRLPVWQFTEAGKLPGLAAVITALPGDQPALVIAGFMTCPQEDLLIDDTPTAPRDWLLAGGDPAPVTRLAANLGTAP